MLNFVLPIIFIVASLLSYLFVQEINYDGDSSNNEPRMSVALTKVTFLALYFGIPVILLAVLWSICHYRFEMPVETMMHHLFKRFANWKLIVALYLVTPVVLLLLIENVHMHLRYVLVICGVINTFISS